MVKTTGGFSTQVAVKKRAASERNVKSTIEVVSTNQKRAAFSSNAPATKDDRAMRKECISHGRTI